MSTSIARDWNISHRDERENRKEEKKKARKQRREHRHPEPKSEWIKAGPPLLEHGEELDRTSKSSRPPEEIMNEIKEITDKIRTGEIERVPIREVSRDTFTDRMDRIIRDLPETDE